MNEMDLETRKKIILDRLADDLAQKEIAEERERADAEEKRIKHEAEQREIFSELEELLPEICDHVWSVMPEFLQHAGSCLSDLAKEYDGLMAEQRVRVTRFNGLRVRFESQAELQELLAKQSILWEKVELPAEIKVLLDVSFTERQVNYFLAHTVLRFLDFRFRALASIDDILTV